MTPLWIHHKPFCSTGFPGGAGHFSLTSDAGYTSVSFHRNDDLRDHICHHPTTTTIPTSIFTSEETSNALCAELGVKTF